MAFSIMERDMTTQNYKESIQYAQIAEELIKTEKSLQWMLKVGTRIAFLECGKPKRSEGKVVFGECIKVEEYQQVFCPYDFIIVVYAPNVYHMTHEQKRILIHHELLHCGFSTTKSGIRYKTVPHDYEDFREIVFTHGLEWAR